MLPLIAGTTFRRACEEEYWRAIYFRGFANSEIPIGLRKELKRAEAHRRTYLKLAEEVDHFFEFGRINYRNLKTSSEQLRRFLGIEIDFLPEARNSKAVWNYWRSMFEQKGFLVFQTTRISLDVFRALSISHSRNPIIVVKGGDYPNEKFFHFSTNSLTLQIWQATSVVWMTA